MKKMTIFFAFVIVMFAFTSNSFGQVIANGTSAAEIVDPYSVDVDRAEMHFGSMTSQSAGTVTITAEATTNRTASGVNLINGITPTSAQLTAHGTAAQGINVELPLSHTIKHTVNATTLTVNNFTWNGDENTVLDGTGNYVIYVGGTLTLNSGEANGTYESTSDFAITVNFE